MSANRLTIVAALFVSGAVVCAASNGSRWTAVELDELRSLSIAQLEPLPPDPTNRVADDPRDVVGGASGDHAPQGQVERVLERLPAPPATVAAPRATDLEVAVGHRSVALDRALDLREELRVPPQPARPARVTRAVVQHGAPPPRQRGDGHEARRVRPVLEQQAPAVHEAVEPCAIVRPEAAPERQVVRPVQHVDGIHLDAAHVLDEPDEPSRRERAAARPGEVLAREEQRRHRAQRNRASRHRAAAYHRPAARGLHHGPLGGGRRPTRGM